ncbi:hypothetical protein SAMN05421736_11544 [Evansella caseinilytica]|uniref:Lipoprotein n=1 Tax=Evansella caseinilytica TaxID=1503961 RepID=A0A1H3TN06_9BACI|nr:hypothetical protein [Evansella caseinilytica]SDZ50729.1 hypothetical protein SAMN05421736_11544 [Evansella caseinilytica]
MIKVKVLGLLVVLVLFSGCSFSFSVGSNNEVADLKLQVRTIDEETGLTLDNNELYEHLIKEVEERPESGIPNDFSLQVVDTMNEGKEDAALIFLAINRTKKPMKNITLSFTMGSKDGEMLWENEPIIMDESIYGVIQPDSAVPLLLRITPEMTELLSRLNDDNLMMKIEDFDYEVGE